MTDSPVTPRTDLTLTVVQNALDEAWLESNDAREIARPPDLAGHLHEALREYIVIEREAAGTEALRAVWRVVREPEDGSWTITDDTRPGFVTAGETLQEAVEDLMEVMALWDETAEAHNIPRVIADDDDERPSTPDTGLTADLEAVIEYAATIWRIVTRREDERPLPSDERAALQWASKELNVALARLTEADR
jgi:predicted RNase H-like HicB family nuclease